MLRYAAVGAISPVRIGSVKFESLHRYSVFQAGKGSSKATGNDTKRGKETVDESTFSDDDELTATFKSDECSELKSFCGHVARNFVFVAM